MHAILMLIVFLGSDGGHAMAKPYQSLAACEADKAAVVASALSTGVTDLGLTCVDVTVAKVS